MLDTQMPVNSHEDLCVTVEQEIIKDQQATIDKLVEAASNLIDSENSRASDYWEPLEELIKTIQSTNT